MKHKYRAWSKEEGKFLQYESGQDNYVPVRVTARGFELASNYELSQWTGLVDNRGIEIYEGDIVVLAEHLKYKTSAKYMRLVEWNHEQARWSIYAGKSYIVVGNKFVNPELVL